MIFKLWKDLVPVSVQRLNVWTGWSCSPKTCQWPFEDAENTEAAAWEREREEGEG